MGKPKNKDISVLQQRKCPNCNKDLSIMYAGQDIGTRIACACGFEIILPQSSLDEREPIVNRGLVMEKCDCCCHLDHRYIPKGFGNHGIMCSECERCDPYFNVESDEEK